MTIVVLLPSELVDVILGWVHEFEEADARQYRSEVLRVGRVSEFDVFRPVCTEIAAGANTMMYLYVLKDVIPSRRVSIENIWVDVVLLPYSDWAKLAAVWCVIWARAGPAACEWITKLKQMPYYSVLTRVDWEDGLYIARRYAPLASIPDQVELV